MQADLELHRHDTDWELEGGARVWVTRDKGAVSLFLLEFYFKQQQKPLTVFTAEERVRIWVLDTWLKTHTPGTRGRFTEHGLYVNGYVFQGDGLRFVSEDEGTGCWNGDSPYMRDFTKRNDMALQISDAQEVRPRRLSVSFSRCLLGCCRG